MELTELLQPYLDSPLFNQILPYVYIGIGALVCFIFMSMLVRKWKSRYRKLQAAHDSFVESVEIENRLRKEKTDLIENASRNMQLEFRNLAHEIFDEKTQILTRQNSEKIDYLLKPYQEQLNAFRDRIETIFLEESRDHSSLKQELLNLRKINDRINDEAVRLSRAISGDNRQQGTWGEIILERVLEQSGLRNGHEFETQTVLRDDDNRLLRPDVIIHLPDGKDIVIDSKMSLVGWSKYVNGDTESERQEGLNEHLGSIRSHVKSLSQKDYSSLKGLRTLDFVLMFIPIEGAFSAALQTEEKLLSEMYARKVIIVSPSQDPRPRTQDPGPKTQDPTPEPIPV